MSRNSKNKPKSDSEEKLGLIYDGETRRSSAKHWFSQNFDFSSFPILCEETYRCFEWEIRNQIPYCVFLHAMNEYLNVYLLRKSRNFFTESFVNYYIPTPIFEYISGIGTVKTATGLDIDFNLPVGGTPQGPLGATEHEEEIESGSFGSCNAETHNSYECYVSPYVTRKLIERTLYANTSTDPDRFGDWSPLPQGRYPQNGVANRNLLGYSEPEKLKDDGIQILREIQFCNGDTPLGRVCHSAKVMSDVSDSLYSWSNHFAMSLFNMKFSSAMGNSAAFIYLNYSKDILPRERLANYVDILVSPESFDALAANKAHYFGYKRKRNPGSTGSCYTVDGKVPEGWEETCNDNFNMFGTFNSKSLRDKPSLRNDDHITKCTHDRRHCISNWVHRFVRI